MRTAARLISILIPFGLTLAGSAPLCAQNSALGEAVMIDPSLKGVKAPRVSGSANMEKALDRLVAETPHTDWTRIEMQAGGKIPSAGRLAVFVRELIRQKSQNILVVNEGERTLHIVSHSASKKLPESAHVANALYLIYDSSPGANSLTAEERFEDLQSDQAKLLLCLSPAQMQNPMMAWMQRIQGHSKDEIERAMAPLHAAGMKMWENTGADQRGQMMEGAMHVMQSFSNTPAAPVGRNYLPELRSAAAVASRKYSCNVLVDPTIFLSTQPDVKSPNSIIEALDGLTSSRAEVSWRAVYLPLGTDLKDILAGDLARIVRWIEFRERGKVIVRRRDSVTTMETDRQAPLDLRAMFQELGLREKPVYLLYSPAGRAGSVEEQFAALQRDQMERMLQMTPDQLGTAMEQAGQLYLSADPSSRDRMMGLPVMAGMMAVWFPRAAKEKGGGGD
jgi:hypothetical protein